MKTLLLASSGKFVSEHASEVLGRDFTKINIAWITTASKAVEDVSYIEVHRKRRQELGWSMEEIDIDGKNTEELRGLLTKKDVIIVEGGNTFFLLKAIRESGFDKFVKKFIRNGGIYIGTSAGSYVATPSIETAAWRDCKQFDRYGVEDFTAIGLVPFLMKVHYKSENKDLIESYTSKAKYETKILTDKQALLIRNDKIEILGEGEEISL